MATTFTKLLRPFRRPLESDCSDQITSVDEAARRLFELNQVAIPVVLSSGDIGYEVDGQDYTAENLVRLARACGLRPPDPAHVPDL